MSMYNEKFVATIKHKGKILREFKDQVKLPFGAEYSVFLKNLNSVRALVKIEIDGVDIGYGTRFVVNANSSVEIERFVKENDQGNRFKFIERTAKIEDHRGIKSDDGLVRIEYQFEKIEKYFPKLGGGCWGRGYYDPNYPNVGSPFYGDTDVKTFMSTSYSGGGMRGLLRSASVNNVSAQSADVTCFSAQSADVAPQNKVENEAGITVAGSVSDQKFSNASWFPTETETHVIVLKLLGKTSDDKIIDKAVTVKSKQKCVTCGHLNKINNKFCAECGTSLILL